MEENKPVLQFIKLPSRYLKDVPLRTTESVGWEPPLRVNPKGRNYVVWEIPCLEGGTYEEQLEWGLDWLSSYSACELIVQYQGGYMTKNEMFFAAVLRHFIFMQYLNPEKAKQVFTPLRFWEPQWIFSERIIKAGWSEQFGVSDDALKFHFAHILDLLDPFPEC